MEVTGLSFLDLAAPSLFWQGCQMLLMLAIAPALIGLIRKVKARLLSRRGPSILQPYRELWRLLHKEAVVADSASSLFRAAPYGQFRRDLGGGGAGADLCHRADVLAGRPT